jgi:hypothetical protein
MLIAENETWIEYSIDMEAKAFLEILKKEWNM